MMFAVLQCLGVEVKVLSVLERSEVDERQEEYDDDERREGKIVPTRPQRVGRELHDHERVGWQVELYDEYVEVSFGQHCMASRRGPDNVTHTF